MSLEVDDKRNNAPLPYRKQDEREILNGYNAYEIHNSLPVEAQDNLIRSLRTTIRGLTIGFVLALVLAIVTAGVARSLAVKRNHTTVIAA